MELQSLKSSLLANISLGLSVLALPGLAFSHETHVESVAFETSGGQETLLIKWSEPTEFSVREFSSAGQLILRLDGAHLDEQFVNQLENNNPALTMQNVRVNEVSSELGNPIVQLRMSMNPWSQYTVTETATFLKIQPIKQAPQPVASQSEIITLSNEDIEALGFGSSEAPSTGAGQAADPSTAPTTAFYVPPDLTQEEREVGVLESDFGMASTFAMFDRSVNLDFKDAELENVVRSIATKLKLNLVLMPGDLKGRVTVSLNNVRLGDAFNAMLRSNDLAYKVEKGGIVRIVPRSEVQVSEKETVTQSIAINWVNAADLITIISPFISDEGQISSHDQSNTIIVSDVPEKVSEVQTLIQRLDVPEKQVRMEVRLVDMTESAFRGLGFQNSYNSQEADSVLLLDGDGNAGDTPEAVAKTVGSIGGTTAVGSGLDFSQNTNFSVFGNKYRLNTRLTALEQRSEAVTLATPTIVTLNNIASSIEIKRQIPYRDAVNSAQGSVSTIRFQDVGTKIDITPRITNNGYIVMDITPEQKILVQIDTATGTPVIDERLAQTTVIAKDEETVMLGGLRQFEAVNSEDGVPWFMKIPVIDFLFQTTENRQNKTELVLFVTPNIIKDPEPTAYERALYDKIDYNWELPDYYFDSVSIRQSKAELNDPYTKVLD